MASRLSRGVGGSCSRDEWRYSERRHHPYHLLWFLGFQVAGLQRDEPGPLDQLVSDEQQQERQQRRVAREEFVPGKHGSGKDAGIGAEKDQEKQRGRQPWRVGIKR